MGGQHAPESTAILKEDIEINDKSFYKEIIDLNFQHFILMLASLYENIVRLAEILIKKIIVHLPENKPISSPLHSYIDFLNILLDLGYRKKDHISSCLSTHTSFLTKYLSTINMLRNRFIHGYSINLGNDGYNYKITTFDPLNFTKNSADLNIDEFSKNIIAGTKSFMLDLLTSLYKAIKPSHKNIPA